MKLAIALIAALALVLPGSAGAKSLTVTRGNVKATLAYSRASGGGTGFKAGKLTIVRAGRTLYDAVPHPKFCHGVTCGPAIGFGRGMSALAVRDLDGDGEPEVIYDAFTGGAHCCTVGEFFSLAASRSHYRPVSHFFGDPGFSVRDLNGGGRPEVVTADDAFAFRFTSYAFSGLPLLVLRYDHGRFRNVTVAFPGRLRSELKQYWRGYLQLRRAHDDTPRGQISAWAADEYRLGRRAHALSILRREVRHGHLASPGGGAKFIHTLDHFLRHRGYA